MPIMKRLALGGVNYDTVGEASVTQVQTSGTKIATVTIDGTATDLYAPEGGGGGSTVTVTPILTSGTQTATISVDGTTSTLYAPTPPTVPSASTTTPLMDGTASYGSGTDYARANHVHPTDTSRQATLVSGTNIKTVNGNSLLGSGDITTPTYTLPTASTSTLGGVKVDGSTITITDGVISSSGGGSVSMEDTEVDAAVEAAWPAPTGYAITPDQGHVDMGHLLAIGLSDTVAEGEFVDAAGEGETVYVMGVDEWEPQVTIDSTGTSVAYALYGPSTSGTLYTFTMPAEAVTVAMWYND